MMIADYQEGELNTKTNQFKVLSGIACLIGLTGVLLGGNPIKIQILSQVFNVFALPLVIISILILINKKSLMGKYKAGIFLNLGIVLSLLFALVISYNGFISVLDYFTKI